MSRNNNPVGQGSYYVMRIAEKPSERNSCFYAYHLGLDLRKT
jgi:hypothetical protein